MAIQFGKQKKEPFELLYIVYFLNNLTSNSGNVQVYKVPQPARQYNQPDPESNG